MASLSARRISLNGRSSSVVCSPRPSAPPPLPFDCPDLCPCLCVKPVAFNQRFGTLRSTVPVSAKMCPSRAAFQTRRERDRTAAALDLAGRPSPHKVDDSAIPVADAVRYPRNRRFLNVFSDDAVRRLRPKVTVTTGPGSTHSPMLRDRHYRTMTATGCAASGDDTDPPTRCGDTDRCCFRPDTALDSD